MRTTVTLDPALLAEAKAQAARQGRTLSDVIADALRAAFARGQAVQRRPVTLPTFGRSGLMPGVDLEEGGGLWDIHDDEAGWRDRG